jgi:hypothetical protein
MQRKGAGTMGHDEALPKRVQGKLINSRTIVAGRITGWAKICSARQILTCDTVTDKVVCGELWPLVLRRFCGKDPTSGVECPRARQPTLGHGRSGIPFEDTGTTRPIGCCIYREREPVCRTNCPVTQMRRAKSFVAGGGSHAPYVGQPQKTRCIAGNSSHWCRRTF